jgi:7,8-dihydro-6-hydroxymethylpterin-pyrophosphokinase
LEPLALLDVLQKIETELGRIKLVDKGPRSIDLDILLYDFDNVQDPRLQIPHKLMLEREFVLRPLAESVAFYCCLITSLLMSVALFLVSDCHHHITKSRSLHILRSWRLARMGRSLLLSRTLGQDYRSLNPMTRHE